VLVVLYTTTGGIKALTWADVQQMTMIFVALIVTFVVAVRALPRSISFGDALHLAGAAGRLTIVDPKLDWSNRYNLWSGLIGGGFLALAYFGCDQSQVQRYLTGKSITASRLSLIFTAIVKIPMQVFILFIGAMVFVVSLFVPSPAIFHPKDAQVIQHAPEWRAVQAQHDAAFEQRRAAAFAFRDAARTPSADLTAKLSALRTAQSNFETSRKSALALGGRVTKASHYDDTNYIFLQFVTHYLPIGLVGLTVGVIFSASMGSTSGEINSLATVSVIDIYKRHIIRDATDRHYLIASRLLTIFWGGYAVAFASFGARGFGALIERVNIVGSLFYGGLLGVFVLAFALPHVRGTAAFLGVLAGEAAIFTVAAATSMSFLWYNVVGSAVVVAVALLVQSVSSARAEGTA
jgi:Na+/proline symporter